MGDYLSKPNKEKEKEDDECDKVNFKLICNYIIN